MKTIKDHFSVQAEYDAKFRPRYPDELFEYLFLITLQKGTAWDCGTGNGQVAMRLAENVKRVYAINSSKHQLSNAPEMQNVTDLVARAEQTTIPDRCVDLITVAQALHWFDVEACYREVRRAAKPGALLALWGYNLLHISPEIDALVNDFYCHTLAGYWDEERVHVEYEYRTLPFSFPKLTVPHFQMTMQWNLEQLIGYLNSWSAVQSFLRDKGTNPVDLLEPRLREFRNDQDSKAVRFPLFIHAGLV
jgi:ubiquinone/menaquinone biosynthesis C-methylase UbiE